MIAAVNGFALGGGCETAMACTMRVAGGEREVRPARSQARCRSGGGGTQRLPRLVGKGRALQLILSGEMISAQEAYRIGLVNEVVPAADLITRAEAILKKIFSNAPIAVKFALEAANKGLETGQSEGLSSKPPISAFAPGQKTRRKAHLLSSKSARPSSMGAERRIATLMTIQEKTNGKRQHFSGLKVVDLASFIAGPGAAVILSDFGADVIKVEPPTGDFWRIGHKIPPQPQAKDAYQWHLANRNKRGMTLDLKSPSAQQVLERLVKWADVLIVNTPHPARKKLKLEYDDVAQWNPRLIYADLTGFGEKGPTPIFRDSTSLHTGRGAACCP